MAQQVVKPMSDSDRSKNRVAARRARIEADRASRGGRDLTTEESYAIAKLVDCVSTCKIVASQIRRGKKPSVNLLRMAGNMAVESADLLSDQSA